MNDTLETHELNQEIIEHLMHPKNYGQIKPANGIGMGYEEQTQEFVIMYLHVEDDAIKNVGYATNGCQDTVVLGSMFTEMINEDTLQNAIRACELMRERIETAPAKQQACADMVLTAFDAALHHYHDGQSEEIHKIAINRTCDTGEIS